MISSTTARNTLRLANRLSSRRSVVARYAAAAGSEPSRPVVSSSSSSTTFGVRYQSTAAAAAQPAAMFCRQCEQTADHFACTGSAGVCGKTAETAASQDALMHQLKSVSLWCQAAREQGVADTDLMHRANVWTLEGTFSTLTNVNFSEERIAEYIREGEALKDEFKAVVKTPPANPVAQLNLKSKTLADLETFAKTVSVPQRAEEMGHEDAFSLHEITTYGLKGLCAYSAHAEMLLQEIDGSSVDDSIMKSIHEVYAKLAEGTPDVNGLLAAAMKVGECNAQVMALLDASHAALLGEPTPRPVRTTAVQGKCILVSGHDMVDLYHLLQQTEGTGVSVYTHGEMLPAHSYPKLAAFKHLAGNYGTAWQNQVFEFASFPGPVIVTTNCIIKPRKVYQDRLYTMNATGMDGVKHLHNRDFSQVIQQAQQSKGFEKTIEPAKFRTAGFNHRVVLTLADQIIEAASNGSLSRILLIGGCDGSQNNRSYFTELAEESDPSTLILTLGCAKNRIINSPKFAVDGLATNQFKLPNGTVIPRVLDMGQCNDAYSAVVVALELAKALKVNSINDLPLSLAVSHLEQKAAAVLLTLLHLGVKNIRLGPSLPAYISPGVLKILQENYNIMGTDAENVKHDLAMMMEGK